MAMLRLKRIFKNYQETGSLNEQVNLYGFVGPEVFLTKTGELGLILEVRGVDYECLDGAAIDALTKRLESALKLFGDDYRVIIMWLTGGKKPQTPTKAIPAVPQVQAPLEVNDAKIVELQNRIQDLQREQLVAENALVLPGHPISASTPDSPQAQQSGAAGNVSAERPEEVIRAERKKREYLSLFSSNLALSYRKSPAGVAASAAEPNSPSSAPDAAQIAQLLKEMQSNSIPPVPTSYSAPARKDSAETPDDRKEEIRTPAAASAGAANASAGKTYVLFEGNILETVLINRLDGQFSGPVECLLSTDVYSTDRQHLLIPAGSKLLGETKKVDSFGQKRLAVVFHRLLMPDGFSLSLDQFKGLNQIGDTGLRDQVNNHYLRMFGVSLAIGALGAVAEAGTGSAITASGTDRMRQGLAGTMAQSSAQILDKFLNILPTVTIREGHRVKVYLSGDLALPDYNYHKMPSDL
jgi:type IV secretory pathway VirB10-like protein